MDLLWISWKSIRLIIGPSSCRYYPSCSEYSREAFKKYNPLKATIISVWRIVRCNPFSKGGYDPLK
ncbi:MAG: membrane protein insertion efficiency factor YidD [Elusimicrobiales bacterium]